MQQVVLINLLTVVCAMSNSDSFGHHWGKNGEFRVAVSPVARTAGCWHTGLA